jgi:hypothetical protein
VSAVVLARLRDLFLAPGAARAEAAPAMRVAERVVPATFAVLAAPDDAAVAGAALGLAAARAHRAPCALVCVWTGRPAGVPPRSALAAGAARRLTGRLAARGLDAGRRGRLVTVALPPAEAEARAAAERALAAAGDLPVVLVVAGPRPAALDALLGAVDRVVVAPAPGAPAGLEDLAVADAARVGRSIAVLGLPAGGSPGARLLLSAGLGVSAALRSAADATLGGDRG